MLKKTRERRKLTQGELAKRVGVHRVTIARIEGGTGRPSLPLLERLAKALKVGISQLLE